MAENITFVPSRLKSSVVGGYVTGADQVYDDTLGKSQAEVNAGIDTIVKEKVDEKIAEGISDTVSEIVEAKVSTAVDGKIEALDIPSAVDAAVESQIEEKVPAAIEQQVPTIINQTIYGSDTKPEGAEPITTENFSDKLSESLDGAIGDTLDSKINAALDEKLENLDIEDTNTTYKLSVNGTAYGDSEGVDLGSVYAPVSAGSNGQFLMSNGSGAPVWAEIPAGGDGGVTPEQVTRIINQELYGNVEKPENAETVTTENLAQTLADYAKSEDIPAVADWAKSAEKPVYNYSETQYAINKATTEGGTVSIDASIPVHEIIATGNISAVTFAEGTVPEEGHSCHIIVKAAVACTINIANGATVATVDGVGFTTICPKSADISLDVTAGGYIEFDLFRIGESIYVRGI